MFQRINLICHGYVATPIIASLQKNGFFSLLEEEGAVTQEYVCEKLKANPKQLQNALDLLESMDWLSYNSLDEYTLTQRAQLLLKILPNMLDLYQFSMLDYFKSETITLQPWIDEITKTGNELQNEFFEGCLLVPLLVALIEQQHLASNSSEKLLSLLTNSAHREISALLFKKRWLTNENGIQLTSDGKFILENVDKLKIVYSYQPLLVKMNEILFGDDHQSQLIIQQIKTSLYSIDNLQYQNAECLAKFDEAILEIFNKTPIDLQPRYIVQTGCKDGTLLKRLYENVKIYSIRGTMLEKSPLILVAVEKDEKLSLIREQLQGYPHILLTADINEPETIQQKMQESGVLSDQTLHVHFLLAHKHSLFLQESKPIEKEEKDKNDSASRGKDMQKSIGRDMTERANIIGTPGCLVLEPHSVSPSIKKKYFYESNDFSLDVCQAFLSKSLIDARSFIMNAAEVGLFPINECSYRFPQEQSYTQITFNHFKKRPYIIRTAKLSDIDELLVLEEKCWAKPLRVARHVLHERINRYAAGQYVMELNGEVVGVIYTQRMEDKEKVFSYNFRKIEENHKKNAPILQLLAANILPKFQGQALGDQLLEFVLQVAAVTNDVGQVIAVTRCCDFDKQAKLSMADYIKTRNAEGMIADPVLYFHEMHGATIGKVVPNYRPGDTPNNNHGVLISYDIRNRKRLDQLFKNVERPVVMNSEQRAVRAKLIEDIIRKAVEERAGRALDLDVPLMQLGLKSVDLTNLKGQLSTRLSENISQDFFYIYPTANAAIKKLCEPTSEILVSSLPRQRLHIAPRKIPIQSIAQTQPYLGNHDSGELKEAIAIIGMSCKFPGGVNTPEDYWQLLKNSDDPISQVPSSRWSQTELNSKAGWGGFLDKIDFFDAPFFNINAAEAAAMDPQQRIHLEEIWKALENAHINPLDLMEKNVGIFVGLFSEDYKQLSIQSHAESSIYFSTGTSSAAAAGRIAYFLGTQGPTMTVNTACSSSLVALHLASESLLSGESNIALASGVNLLLTPELSENFANAGMLSQDGRCKSFDAAANGYVRSEGCSVVVLKRLSDARRDKDRVYAVIESTVINQDGKSTVLTAPNPKAQEELFKKSLKVAHRLPQEVDYIEAHGTGTPLGDPLEVNSIVKVYGGQREKPLIIGSVKANIGHTESAAGLAGLIKVVLSLQYELLPKQLHFNTINPAIRNEGNIVIPAEKTPWLRRQNGDKAANFLN